MVLSEQQLDRLAVPLREPVREYASRLAALMPDHLLAVVVYGSAAANTFITGRHAVRNAAVLRSIDLDGLRRLGTIGPKFGRLGIAAPMVMTGESIASSLDTFPLELLEIEQQHFTVWGNEFFTGLAFQREHVRLQCERELKVVQIALRQGLLAAGDDDRLLGALGSDWSEPLLRIVRGMLWLKGRTAGLTAFKAVEEAEKLFELKLPGVLAALDHANTAGWNKFVLLHTDVQALGQLADGL